MGDRKAPRPGPRNQVKPARRPAPPPDRREAFNRFAHEVGAYLETVGWRAVVVGSPRIEGVEVAGLGRYRLTVDFSGGRIKGVSSETP